MPLYGRHGSIRARPGQREALLAVMLEAASRAASMPGCRAYVVGTIPDDPDAVAVTEVWTDATAHRSSLSLDSVRATISRARQLIAEVGPATEFAPVGAYAWRPLPPSTYVVLDIPPPFADAVLEHRRRYGDASRWSFPADTTVSGSSGTGPLSIDQELEEVTRVIGRIARETRPIRARFGPVRRFEGSDVFYLSFEDEAPLRGLHERIARSGLRFEPSPFPFTPHCTIRTSAPSSDDDLRELERIRIDGEFVLDTLSLYELSARTPPADGFATMLCLLHRVRLGGV
jgi:quinol monooxygenase YgiN